MEKTFKKYFIKRVLLRVGIMGAAFTIVMMAIQSAEMMEHLDGVSTWFFLYYLFLSFPSMMVMVLAFVFPLGAFWAISYMQGDGEILAMQNVGIAGRTLMLWVLECATLALALIWLMVSVVEPESINYITKTTAQYTKNHLFSMLKPNAFNIKNDQVIYAHDVDANSHILNHVVMLKPGQDGAWVFVNAKQLKEQPDGSVVLEKGKGIRYTIEQDKIQKTEVVDFNEMTTDPYRLFEIKQNKSNHVQTLSTLWKNRHKHTALARLCWMTGVPLMTFLLVIMAACEMLTPPRATHYLRGVKFIVTMLMALLLLIIVQRQAGDGHLRHIPILALVLPPLGMALWVYWLGKIKQLVQ